MRRRLTTALLGVALLIGGGAVADASHAAIARAPLGPTGTWHVAYADQFAVPLSQDPMWELKTNAHGCCNNTSAGNNETSSESPSAVHQSATGGLELKCEGLVCSGVSQRHFLYELGRGATFVFQVVAQLPYDGLHNGEDPGAWGIGTTRWPPEIDFFEWWAWNCTVTVNCVGGFPVYRGTAGQRELYFLPTESYWKQFHTYTTLVEGSTFTEYIDGVRKGSFTETVNTDRMEMAFTHALRETQAGRSSSFDVRSIAVYEDEAHKGQAVVGEGLAPGTTLEGETLEEVVKEDPDLFKDEAAESSVGAVIAAAEHAIAGVRAAVVAAESTLAAAKTALAKVQEDR